MASSSTASFLPTPALDQLLCGITAGVVSTLTMQPLDLLKVQLQVASSADGPVKGKGKGKGKGRAEGMWGALKQMKAQGGWGAYYRGLSPNLLGNAASWGLYFYWYSLFKGQMDAGPSGKLSAGQHLLASAESGVVTAVMTNPIWVVKTRMFTSRADDPAAYKNVFHGISQLAKQEGFRGLSKGMVLALVGVSNGAIQFMTYEELKRWRTDLRRAQLGTQASEEEVRKLSNTEYILMSGSAKLFAIGCTYPYQVIRSRIQYQPPTTVEPYTSIPDCVRRTYLSDGLRGFYKGLGTNAVRILPGTCVTFVVYENVARWTRARAVERDVVASKD